MQTRTNLVEADGGPGGGRGGGGDGQQDPVVGDEGLGQLVVGRGGAAVLVADGAEEVEVGPDVLADLDGAGEGHVAVAGGVIDDQLDAGVAGEDLVLHPG